MRKRQYKITNFYFYPSLITNLYLARTANKRNCESVKIPTKDLCNIRSTPPTAEFHENFPSNYFIFDQLYFNSVASCETSAAMRLQTYDTAEIRHFEKQAFDATHLGDPSIKYFIQSRTAESEYITMLHTRASTYASIRCASVKVKVLRWPFYINDSFIDTSVLFRLSPPRRLD